MSCNHLDRDMHIKMRICGFCPKKNRVRTSGDGPWGASTFQINFVCIKI